MPHPSLMKGAPREDQLDYLQDAAERTQKVAETDFLITRLKNGFEGVIINDLVGADASFAAWGYPSRRGKAAKWKIEQFFVKASRKNKAVSFSGHKVTFKPGYTTTDVQEYNHFIDRAMNKHWFYESTLVPMRPPAGGRALTKLNEAGQLVPRFTAEEADKAVGKGLSFPFDPQFAAVPETISLSMAMVQHGRFDRSLKANPSSLGVGMLGNKGPNFAFDPILLVQGKDGRYSVLSGRRPTGEFAFPGGMAEAGAYGTVTNEFLEECCSGSFFLDDLAGKPGSTANLVNAMEPAKFIANMTAFFKKHLAGALKPLEGFTDHIYRMIAFDRWTQNQRINQIKEFIDQLELPADEVHHLIVKLKCTLFQELLPANYDKVKTFIRTNLAKGAKGPNVTDPRGTAGENAGRWMVAQALHGSVTQEQFETMLHEAGVEMIPGDDLMEPGLVPVEVFLQNAYADHGRMLLESVHTLVKDGKMEMTDGFLEQLQIYDGALYEREALDKIAEKRLGNGNENNRDVLGAIVADRTAFRAEAMARHLGTSAELATYLAAQQGQQGPEGARGPVGVAGQGQAFQPLFQI